MVRRSPVGWDSRTATRLAYRAALVWGALCGIYALLDWRFSRLAIGTAHALAGCLNHVGLDAQVAGTVVAWQGGRRSRSFPSAPGSTAPRSSLPSCSRLRWGSGPDSLGSRSA